LDRPGTYNLHEDNKDVTNFNTYLTDREPPPSATPQLRDTFLEAHDQPLTVEARHRVIQNRRSADRFHAGGRRACFYGRP
jgi:hypothetical protein